MRNPFRTEESAFRFLLATIGFFALVVLASWLSPWLGLAVFATLAGLGVVALRSRGVAAPTLGGARAEVADTPPSADAAAEESERRGS